MKYSDIPSARAIVYHCKARGIENIVISPGSRNAPLILGFTSDPFFKCFSIVDERSAGFFALGIAQQLRTPVAVICTSGSALLNYYPAVAEAFYSDIPLVVISADRPVYKIDIGDGQTIRQDHVFDRHIGFTALLKQDLIHARSELELWGALPTDIESKKLQDLQIEVQAHNDSQLNQAMKIVYQNRKPVHINVPLEEPLYGLIEEATSKPEVDLSDSYEKKAVQEIDELTRIWNSSEKKLIIAGVLYPNSLDGELLELWAQDPSVSVLTETTSNIVYSNFLHSIDSVVAPVELADQKDEIFQKLKPDLLITMGGMIVSKKIKAFIRNWRPNRHWHVNEKKAYDTFKALTRHIAMEPADFFASFLQKTKTLKSGYKEIWSNLNTQQKNLRKTYLRKIPFSDMMAFDYIFKAIPENYQVQLANSSTVRYSQLFDMDPSHTIYCNRGTSGIDGSTSTAVGAAFYNTGPTLLISGDLSFLYDVNGLWNEYVRNDFRIIVINNGGGGIFRILPGEKSSENFEQFFETTHHAQLNKICENFKLTYLTARDEVSLKHALSSFFKPGNKGKLLEVNTPRIINDRILLEYFEFISSEIYS
ncbi:MAG: 2-succinyl-5-enolpyruvyl-6-hydroxy-3-cyclohexene-1-carboxylate synthase [Flavobacteriaceae bacterium]